LNREAGVRAVFVACVLSALAGVVGAESASAKSQRLHLAQSSTTTNCMLGCNTTAATCQAACVVPASSASGAATTGGNATASGSCLMTCSTEQLNCQTNCARTSPSQ
jgi:hypothetical protein